MSTALQPPQGLSLTELYQRSMKKETWKRHERFFTFVIRWQEDRDDRSIAHVDDLVDFLAWLNLHEGYLSWNRDKISRLRTALGHWVKTHTPMEADWWKNDVVNACFKGTWYDHKKGSHPEDKKTIRGILCPKKLEALIEWLEANPAVLEGRNLETIREAMSFILLFMLRNKEFTKFQIGDYDTATNIAHLRHNKAFNASSPPGVTDEQWVPVATTAAVQLVTDLQDRAASRKGKGSNLLFRWSDASAALLCRIIKAGAIALRWETSLDWCLHSLRHGGVQYLQEIARLRREAGQPVNETFFLAAMHMKESTREDCYGVPAHIRIETAKRRQATKAEHERQKRARGDL